MPTDLVNKRTAAEILERDVSTVQRMVTDGRLKVAFESPGPNRTAAYFFKRSDVVKLRRKLAAEESAAVAS